MNWLKNGAAQASQRLEATLQESGVSQKLAGVTEKLAPVTNVAQETKSLFSSLSSTLEESFNKASTGIQCRRISSLSQLTHMSLISRTTYQRIHLPFLTTKPSCSFYACFIAMARSILTRVESVVTQSKSHLS